MAAITKPTRTEAQIASQSVTTNTDTSGLSFGISADTTEILLYTKVSSRTDGTYTPKIEGSIDGTTFVTLVSGTAISTNTQNFTELAVAVDGALPPIIRATVTSASVTTGATVEATIYVNKK